MRRIISILAVLIIGNSVIAQEQKGPLLFAETEYSFDTILQGEECIHVFRFNNNGDKPLNIVSAFTSCGCVVADWTKGPIEPQCGGEIKVKYNAATEGLFQKAIVVKTDEETFSKFVLRIEGVVKKL